MTTTLTPDHVRSADGTRIAYESTGTGPAVIVVDGALCYRDFGPSRKLAAALTGCTTYVYDRRGRGGSGAGETPYAPARELEDLAALIAAAGGSATLVGLSSGAILATDAATALPGVTGLVAYEPAMVVEPGPDVLPADHVAQVRAAVDAGRPDRAVMLFLKRVGAPAPVRAVMRVLPMWKKLAGVGHTLPYDQAVVGDLQSGRPPAPGRWAPLPIPAIVLSGGRTWGWATRGAQALADTLGTTHEVLPGQTHNVKPAVLAAAVRDFLAR